jgi:hypothetical protein
MRKEVMAAATVLLSACGAGQLAREFTGPVPGTGAQAFDCVTRQLSTLGYTTTATSRTTEGGVIRAERMDEQPWWLRVIGYNDAVDVLDITVQGAPARIRAAAYTAVVRDQQRSAAAPSEEARDDAFTVQNSCSRT